MLDMVLTTSCGSKKGGSEMKISISNFMKLNLGSGPMKAMKEARLGNWQCWAMMWRQERHQPN